MLLRRINDWPTWERRRGAFDELERRRRQMDRLFEGLTGGLFREPSAGVFPSVNVTEDNDSYYIRAELPGIRADEIDLQVIGRNLMNSGERRIHFEGESAKYHRREREAGKFSRVIGLPGDINAGKVDAQMVDGMLTVALAKSEASKPKQIPVK